MTTAPRRVALIEGDGAGPEVVQAAVAVVDAAGASVAWEPVAAVAVSEPDDPSRVAHDGPIVAAEVRSAIDSADAALFGSTSGAARQALFYLRWGKQTYANVRPVTWYEGARTPHRDAAAIDMVIVRENLEDLYVAVEGDLAELAVLGRFGPDGSPVASHRGAFAVKAITEQGARRVALFACSLADERRRRGRSAGVVAVGTKHNLLTRSDGLFRDVCLDVAAQFPQVEMRSYIVDDLAARMVADPASLDVVVLPNQYGDILSDAAAGLVGGLGMTPSGCYGDDYAYFEPVHGTAPDIAGKGIANPTAAILSAAMMLEHLGQEAAAARIELAVRTVYRDQRSLTVDQGGDASTADFTKGVLDAIAAGE